jgi:hypothetical protein
LTDSAISETTRRMGRPKLWAKPVLVKLPEGMKERMDALLGPDEARTDFIRQAIEREIKRRARGAR